MYVFDILSIPYPFPLFFFFCHVSFLLYLFLSFPLFFCLSFICVFFFRYVCLPVNILLLCFKLGVVLRKGDVDRPRDTYCGCLRKLRPLATLSLTASQTWRCQATQTQTVAPRGCRLLFHEDEDSHQLLGRVVLCQPL